MQAISMLHETDPADGIWAALRSRLESVKVYHNLILVAQYIRPEQTSGGIFLPPNARKEDEYQGKVGLVVKKGPMAFVDDGANEFHGQDVAIGDWVCFRTSDGWPLLIGETHCRFLEEAHIKARVASPDIVF